MIGVQYVEIDGGLGFVEVAGEGRPLVCVHTAGQSGVQWRDVLRRMPCHGYQVIVPDLPGHGRSDLLEDGPVTDLSRYSLWLTDLLVRLNVRHPLIVGCSIGGKIALELAGSETVAPRAVVAMAADAHNMELSVSGLRRGLEDAASPSRADRTYFGTLASLGRAMPADLARKSAARHRREDPVVSTADLIGWATHDLRPRLQAITCPVRLVVGEDDYWLDPADVMWAAQNIADCTYELLPRVGHYPMEEIPDFPLVLDNWFRQLLRED